MSRPLNEAWIRERLSDRINDQDQILLEGEMDASNIVVDINLFLEMFGGVDVEPNASAASARDRLKGRDKTRINPETGEPDPNGVEAERGYAPYFDNWHAEGRFNSNPPTPASS